MSKKTKKKIIKNDSIIVDDEEVISEKENEVEVKLLNKKVLFQQKINHDMHVNKFLKLNISSEVFNQNCNC